MVVGVGFSSCARMLGELTMSLSPFFSPLSVPNNASSALVTALSRCMSNAVDLCNS